jgi:hypothetical protein
MMGKQKFNFGDQLHPGLIKNKLILGALITDLFCEFMEEGISHISQNEILEYVGVPEKYIDMNDVVLYDTKTLAKRLKGIDKVILYDIVEKMLMEA